ncbi:TPA: conjugal transfer protein TraG N-terminal domain-containing protein, partial [Mannheimia haemolytica]|nr:conjugal transfer protein TraG N-terminal domain-containing protein [Mannheimia haemolytica]
FEVQHEKINNPALLTEVRLFVQQCYVPARQKIQNSQLSLSPAQVRETSWLGGRILIANSELYPRYRAQQPHSLFPYNASRDNGLPNNGEGGFPNCAEWWDTANNGLKDRLLDDVKQNFSAKVIDFFSSKENSDESILRTVLRAENMDISRGKVYPGYGGNLDRSFTNEVTKTASMFGLSLGSIGAFPAFDSMRQALPMVHSFALMALIILTPLIMVMSGYSLKTLVTLTFVNFALVTLTFWWELARWLDSWLLSVLYDSGTHSRINPYFLENTQDDIIVNFVMGSMFLVLPAIWLGSMSWVGVKMGEFASHLTTGSRDSKTAGSKIGK